MTPKKAKSQGFFSSLSQQDTGSLGVARFFSWISLVLIMISSVVLALFIGSNTRSSLLDSQEDYALLLAENMNKQIFRRFSLPVAYASGRIALSEPDQYRLLDEVVESLMHGLRIESIRIYDNKYAVTYSTNREEVQSEKLYTAGVPLIFSGTPHHFDVISRVSYWKSLFTFELPPRSFVLRTIYPLTIDTELKSFVTPENEDETHILGALEIMQDVTSHYQIAIRSQWAIMIGFMTSTLVLFLLIQIIARRAERIITIRMEQTSRLEAELHQSEKLASMGRMVASIAHEIRNPLGIIRSSAEFLLRRKNVDSASQPLLEAIFDESCRLGSTVNDFLDYARPREPGNTPVDLVAVVQKVWAFLGASFETQGITAHFDLPQRLIIAGDSDLLYRAFYNIFVNAQQAMNGAGDFYIVGAVENGKVVLRFQDTGSGFKDEYISRVLDPFFTTKETGTGLGLPIVHSIVTTHHGELLLSNSADGGALIEIIFPLYNGDNSQSSGDAHE